MTAPHVYIDHQAGGGAEESRGRRGAQGPSFTFCARRRYVGAEQFVRPRRGGSSSRERIRQTGTIGDVGRGAANGMPSSSARRGHDCRERSGMTRTGESYAGGHACAIQPSGRRQRGYETTTTILRCYSIGGVFVTVVVVTVKIDDDERFLESGHPQHGVVYSRALS